MNIDTGQWRMPRQLHRHHIDTDLSNRCKQILSFLIGDKRFPQSLLRHLTDTEKETLA